MALADPEVMDVEMLRDWCRWMNVSFRRSLLILGIPEDCTDDQLQQCLEGSLSQMGKFEVLGRVFREEDDAIAALVNLKQEVNYALVPREIPGIGRPWSVVFVPRCSGEDFLGRLFNFLEQQGQTVESIAGTLGLGLRRVCWLRSFSRVIQPWVETVHYQPLRVFSGSDPPAPGELSFEPWLDHATEMMLVWEGVSEREKSRRLTEGLRGAALQVAYDVLASHRVRTVHQCLDALFHVFGVRECEASLRLKCVTAEQQPGETLTAFVVRLEGLLQKALRAKALDELSIEHLRSRQVLNGAHLIRKMEKILAEKVSKGRYPGFEDIVAMAQESERMKGIAAKKMLREQQAQGAAATATAQADATAKAQAEGDKVEEKQREQENSDNHARVPAGLGQTGLSEASQRKGEREENRPGMEGSPLPDHMGSASLAGPRDPDTVLGHLVQALDQEAEEHYQEGLKPILEESESEDGAGELSPSMPSPGK
ncbi:unnamed protein product [Pipistrellus nathusii]|uniref:PNMA family member 6A n=1 Tax=Pipistrellus nathusii TaxID=59473 RepID=A0ABP0ALY9_PIPNA